MKVKCPCLNCPYFVTVEEGYFHRSEESAYNILLRHVKNDHTIGEIHEWLERALVTYFREHKLKCVTCGAPKRRKTL